MSEQSFNTPACLAEQLSLDDAAQEAKSENFTERACQVAGCALRYRMAHDEHIPIITSGISEEQGIVFRDELSEPYTGVLQEDMCKDVKEFWLSSPVDDAE